MPRRARNYLAGNYFHVIIRGNGKQIIFESTNDKAKFLSLLEGLLEENKCTLHAYCLMDNHVHFLLGGNINNISKLMHRLETSYVLYFNKRYERAGTLFQGRFFSEDILDDNYLISVIRYIHRNPENAGICPAEAYNWSSYKDYIDAFDDFGDEKAFVDTSFVLGILGDVDAFKSLILEEDDIVGADVDCDEDTSYCERVITYVKGKYNLDDPHSIAEYSKEKRDRIIRELKNDNISVKSIHLITGLSEYIVRRA